MKCLFVFVIFAAVAFAAVPDWFSTWAVIIAGDSGWASYPTQSSMCKVFQLVRQSGISEDHIITFFADDIAYNDENPFPGQIFNEEYDELGGNVNVYANMVKDYTGKDASVENFINVMTGVPTSSVSGKILRSRDGSDNVFVFFVGHAEGNRDLIFPNGKLSPDMLAKVIANITGSNMFKKLLWIHDSDHSATTFYRNLFYQKDTLFLTSNDGYGQNPSTCKHDPFIHADVTRCWSYQFTHLLEDKGLDLSIEDLYAEFRKFTSGKGCQFGDALVKNMTLKEFVFNQKATVPESHPPIGVPGLAFCNNGECSANSCDCYGICKRRGYPDSRCSTLCCDDSKCFY